MHVHGRLERTAHTHDIDRNMSTTSRDTPVVERLNAFVRGELRGAERDAMERLLDQDPEARALLGVLAREQDGLGPTLGAIRDPYLGMLLAGRYQIRSRVGAGGMGVVYEAEHLMLGRRVALKLLKPEYAQNTDIRKRFENEARVAASLEHDNIVRALDVGRVQDGSPFIVFEMLRGTDLEAQLADRTLALGEVASIGHRLADALVCAHAAGVVHRDIKPSNVFLVEGVPKLIDFGISKLRSEMATQTGAFMGTPAYMPPEQLADASRVEGSADVYSLCAVLHRALAGHLPHDASGLASLVRAKAEPAPSLRELRPELPRELDAIVRLALSPDPTARPSASALRDALEPFVVSAHAPAVEHGQERRIVAAIWTNGVSLDHFGDGVRPHGRVIREGVVVYGETSWDRDLLKEAARAALAWVRADPSALAVVGTARLEGDELRGETAGRFQAAKRRGLSGAFASRDVLAMFGKMPAVEVTEGLCVLDASFEPSQRSLLGRRAELALLDEALERFVDEREALALVVEGPLGIGKSRLLAEGVRLAGQHDMSVACVRAHAQAGHRFLARLHQEVVRASGAAEVELLAWLGTSAAEQASVLRRMSAGPTSSAGSQVFVDRLRVAMLHLVRGAAARRPLLIVAENMHALSRDLCVFLEQLIDGPDAIMLLASSREPDVLRGPNKTSLTLRGLRRSHVRRLAAEAAGREFSDEEVSSLVERSEGNPFFVEQFAVATPGAFPISVEAAIQTRLDSLAADRRTVALALAVLGDEAFDPQLASAVVSVDAIGRADIPGLLEALRGHGLLRRGEAAGTYRFRSATLAQTARSMLTVERSRALHQRAASFLMRQLEPPASRIAAHLEAANAPTSASWYTRAALDAARLGDHEQTVRFAAKATALGERSYPLSMAVAEVHGHWGRFDLEAAALEQARLLGQEDDERAEATCRLAVTHLRRGMLQESLGAMAEAEDLAADPPVRAAVLARHAVVLSYARRVGEAMQRIGEVERMVMTRVPELRPELAQWRAQIACRTGDLADSRNCFWVAAELHGERGDIRRRAECAANLADIYNRLGAYGEAARALRTAADECQVLALRVPEGYARANLAYALTRLGDLATAKLELERARLLVAQCRHPRLAFTIRLYALRVAEAEGRGRTEEAASLAKDCLEAGLLTFAALALTAEARLWLPDGERALSASRRSMDVLRDLGSLAEDEAEVWLGHAAALRATGDMVGAERTLDQGRTVVLTRARRIGELLWRERYLQDVPAHAELLREDRPSS